ncbi:MAG: class I SAM-dependent methyltransferase [Anaerolineaceae bacterium]|nr:class I SAM-dependent methyltransferase [Anaerolineaceae bacterium]
MNPLEKTRQTYRHIAAAYAQAQQNSEHREQMNAQLEKFAALLPTGAVVLDVGCGPGMDTAVLRTTHHLQAIGLDFSHEMMLAGREGLGNQAPFAQADMRRLPVGGLGGGHIAGLWVCASLLHLAREDVLPTLHEFHRVLQPGGVLYLSVKLGDGEAWVTNPYDQTHPRFFTYWQPEMLDALLETAAFHIIEGWQEQGRRDTWLVRYARKEEPHE